MSTDTKTIDILTRIAIATEKIAAALEGPRPAVRVQQEPKTQQSVIASHNHAPAHDFKAKETLPLVENHTVFPRPAASKLATLQERLGSRLQDVEVVEGFDGLCVKPKRYLGDSWAEINEVVRSLGGHWQKGNGPKDGSWRIPK
jgi:hypothetical protein